MYNIFKMPKKKKKNIGKKPKNKGPVNKPKIIIDNELNDSLKNYNDEVKENSETKINKLELNELNKEIDEGNFLFEYDNIEDSVDDKNNNENIKNNILSDEVMNIPLEQIKSYKNIIEMCKIIKYNPLNYDFIKKREINDIKKDPKLE